MEAAKKKRIELATHFMEYLEVTGMNWKGFNQLRSQRPNEKGFDAELMVHKFSRYDAVLINLSADDFLKRPEIKKALVTREEKKKAVEAFVENSIGCSFKPSKVNKDTSKSSLTHSSSVTTIEKEDEKDTLLCSTNKSLLSTVGAHLFTLHTFQAEHDAFDRLAQTTAISSKIYVSLLCFNFCTYPIHKQQFQLLQESDTTLYQNDTLVLSHLDQQHVDYSLMHVHLGKDPAITSTILGDAVFKSLWEAYCRLPPEFRDTDVRFSTDHINAEFHAYARLKLIDLVNLAVPQSLPQSQTTPYLVTLDQIRNSFAHHQHRVHIQAGHGDPVVELWNSTADKKIQNGQHWSLSPARRVVECMDSIGKSRNSLAASSSTLSTSSYVIGAR